MNPTRFCYQTQGHLSSGQAVMAHIAAPCVVRIATFNCHFFTDNRVGAPCRRSGAVTSVCQAWLRLLTCVGDCVRGSRATHHCYGR